MDYSIPEHISISPECKDLLSQIFVKNPSEVHKTDSQTFIFCKTFVLWRVNCHSWHAWA